MKLIKKVVIINGFNITYYPTLMFFSVSDRYGDEQLFIENWDDFDKIGRVPNIWTVSKIDGSTANEIQNFINGIHNAFEFPIKLDHSNSSYYTNTEIVDGQTIIDNVGGIYAVTIPKYNFLNVCRNELHGDATYETFVLGGNNTRMENYSYLMSKLGYRDYIVAGSSSHYTFKADYQCKNLIKVCKKIKYWNKMGLIGLDTKVLFVNRYQLNVGEFKSLDFELAVKDIKKISSFNKLEKLLSLKFG